MRCVTDVGANAGNSGRVDFGPDVVDQRARDPLLVAGGNQHGDETAERGADEYRLRDAELVEQLQHIAGIAGRDIAFGLGVGIAQAPAPEIERDHPPFARDLIGHRFEIARIAGQAGQAKQGWLVGRAPGIVAVMEPNPVGTVEVSILEIGHFLRFPLFSV